MKTSTGLAGALALAFLAASLGTLSAASAQTAGAGQVASGQTGGSVAFVRDCGNAGRFEVQSGRLALERSRHAGVRGYAGQTVRDAGDMLGRVTFINNANVGAAMPDGMDTDQQARLIQLASLSGADFDRAYMQAQIEIGERLRQTFSDYAANGESPTLRLYAAKAVTGYDAQILKARTLSGSL